MGRKERHDNNFEYATIRKCVRRTFGVRKVDFLLDKVISPQELGGASIEHSEIINKYLRQ